MAVTRVTMMTHRPTLMPILVSTSAFETSSPEITITCFHDQSVLSNKHDRKEEKENDEKGIHK
jgi:hypothetical protein